MEFEIGGCADISAQEKRLQERGYSTDAIEDYKLKYPTRFQNVPPESSLSYVRILMSQTKSRLMLLLMLDIKGYNVPAFEDFIRRNPNYNDYTAIMALKHKEREKLNHPDSTDPVLPALRRLKTIQNFKVTDDSRYLDVGCGSGKKTAQFAKAIGIKSGNVFCVDIEEWGPYKEKRPILESNNITLKTYNGNEAFPFADNAFDVVSAFMVMHHARNLSLFVKELSRVTKKGGFVILQEHDVFTAEQLMIISLEHTLYEFKYENKKPENYQGEYAKYLSWIEIDCIMKCYGFEHIKFVQSQKIDYPGMNFLSPTRSFFYMYQKT